MHNKTSRNENSRLNYSKFYILFPKGLILKHTIFRLPKCMYNKIPRLLGLYDNIP